jgi:titin
MIGLLQALPGELGAAFAATGLNVFVGYMDTHTVGSSSNQPSPWPYTDPSSYLGSPCPRYPNDTTCWDAAALRLDNPGSTDVTGVHPVVTIGSRTYNLWGSALTVKAHGSLVLTETGSQNSTNFDASDFSPNAYNGGNVASCANSGAIPAVDITIGGVTTRYLDSGQVLNGGGVDSGHCLHGSFVSGRMDESHPWVQIGANGPTVPSAPQRLLANAGSGSVSLNWSAPASDGGSAISGYDIFRGTASGTESATPIATNVSSTSFTDLGVTNGTPYFYTVSAVNRVGVSPQSAEVSATPMSVQATVPSAPQGLSASGGNGSVRLSWRVPASDGGSAITGYTVYRGTMSGGESPTPVATGVSGTSFTDTALMNGTAYYYQVAAVNAVGRSGLSTEASATPVATVPTAPQGLVASGGDTSVVLSWSAPTSDGGSPITGYNVYRGTAPGGEPVTPLASGVPTTGFTDHGVVNGTTYYYKVTAVNTVGPSAFSNEASATPHTPVTAGFVRRVAAATVTGSRTTTALPVSAPGIPSGDTIVITLLLSSTSSINNAVSATDTAGNTYVIGRDVNDGSAGDRTLTLLATNALPLAAGATISLKYPSSAETHVSADEFAGVTAIDGSAGTTASSAAFSSGASPPTSQPDELLIGVVGNESGSGPSWSAGWNALPVLSISSDHLDTAYRIVNSLGTYGAAGNIGGQWMAEVLTLKTG